MFYSGNKSRDTFQEEWFCDGWKYLFYITTFHSTKLICFDKSFYIHSLEKHLFFDRLKRKSFQVSVFKFLIFRNCSTKSDYSVLGNKKSFS